MWVWGGRPPLLPQALVQSIANRTLTAHAAHWLLRDVAVIATRLYGPADASPFTARLPLADRLVAAARPHLHSPSLPPLLLDALHAVLYAGAPALPPAAVGAGLSVVAAATAAVWEAGAARCGPAPVLDLPASLPLRVSRVPPEGPPQRVAVGDVAVDFPPSLAAVLGPGVWDLTVAALPAAEGGPVGVAAVTFSDAGTGAEAVLRALPEPIAITWPVDGAALLSPVQEYYRCVYEVRGGVRQRSGGLGEGAAGGRAEGAPRSERRWGLAKRLWAVTVGWHCRFGGGGEGVENDLRGVRERGRDDRGFTNAQSKGG